MRKQLLITVGIVLLLGIIGSVLFLGIPIRQELGGFSTLSISNVEVVDNGKFIRIFGVSTGAEALSIDFRSSKINSFINDDGYGVTKSVTGSIILDRQIKRFPIIKITDQNFYELKTQRVGLFSGCSSLTGYTLLGSVISLGTWSSPINKICFYKRGIGINSEFTGQSIRDSSISFNIGGATGTLNPSLGINTITLNDGRTKVEWTGDLSNYDQISNPGSTYSILFHESEFQKLINRNSYALSQDEAIKFSSCMGKSSSALSVFTGGVFSLLSNLKTTSQIGSCINTYNNRVTNILADRTSSYTFSINAKGIDFTFNSLLVDLKTADAFPTFIITLDASKVGIIELSGKPSIVSCVPNKKIQSGDTFSTSISVKNIGTSDGSFFGSISCSGQAMGSGTISEQYVRSGRTVDLPVQITGQNTVADTIKSSTCTYIIKDRKSGASDSCSSTLDVEYQSGLVCEPSSVKCIDADILRTCSNDGKTYADNICDLGCQALPDGTGVCKEKIDIPVDKKCLSFFEQYREEGKGLFGIFPGKQAGCYTAGFVYLIVALIFVMFVVGLLIVVAKIRRKVI